MKPIIIIPYFSMEEVGRYIKIAALMRDFYPPGMDISFLAASSTQIEPSPALSNALSEVAPVSTYQCQNQVVGYPHGASAMFWEIMDHIANHPSHDQASPHFCLWLESDMSPVQDGWVKKLDQQWRRSDARLLMMGYQIPDIFGRWTLNGERKLLAEKHINGGACYHPTFSCEVSEQAREHGAFDMGAFPFVSQSNRHLHTDSFAMSTIDLLQGDIADPNICVVHGWRQNKDAFIDAVCDLSSNRSAHKQDDATSHESCCNLVPRKHPWQLWRSTECPVHRRRRAA